MKKTTTLIIIQLAIIAILLASNLTLLLPKTPPATKKTYTSPSSPTTYSTVDWELTETVPLTLSNYAGKTTPYHQAINISQPNLQQLRFNLTWRDDRAFLLSSRGLDTLTLILTGTDDTFYSASGRSARWTKQGSLQLTIPFQTIKPQSYSFPTPSTTEAEQRHIAQYTDPTTASYTLIVLVDSDDRSLLRRFADQGNTFTLQVTSTYYTPTVSHTTR